MGLILERGMIINQVLRGGESIRIPSRMAQIPQERLRVMSDGTVVDLGDLDQIWVAYRNNTFELYCEPYGESQLVDMTYDQRKLLINDNGTYRIKKSEEITLEKLKITRQNIKKKAIRALKKYNDGYFEIYLVQLILLALYAVRNNDDTVNEFIDGINEATTEVISISKNDGDLKKFFEKAASVINMVVSELAVADDKEGTISIGGK